MNKEQAEQRMGQRITVLRKLEGNRNHTANVIRNIIEDYGMMEDVKELVKKVMKLAA